MNGLTYKYYFKWLISLNLIKGQGCSAIFVTLEEDREERMTGMSHLA